MTWNYRVTDDGMGGEWMAPETAESEQAARDAAQDLLDGGCRAVSCCPSDLSRPGFLLVAYQDTDGDWLWREESLAPEVDPEPETSEPNHLYIAVLDEGETPWQYKSNPGYLDMGTELGNVSIEELIAEAQGCLDAINGGTITDYWDRRPVGRGVWVVTANATGGAR